MFGFWGGKYTVAPPNPRYWAARECSPLIGHTSAWACFSRFVPPVTRWFCRCLTAAGAERYPPIEFDKPLPRPLASFRPWQVPALQLFTGCSSCVSLRFRSSPHLPITCLVPSQNPSSICFGVKICNGALYSAPLLSYCNITLSFGQLKAQPCSFLITSAMAWAMRSNWA